MSNFLTVNKNCIVRDRPCGRLFGGSNSCFIACPSSEEVALELDIIKSILSQEELDPYIAVEHFEPGRDIFCTKICTKIIESRICIALLTGSKNDINRLPNPNVYYEYGLMSAWNKPTIPVQSNDDNLAFNIQSFDTIKYSPSNFKEKIHHAIRVALSKFDQDVNNPSNDSLNSLLINYFELRGLQIMEDSWSTKGTTFIPFMGFNYATIIYADHEIERIQIEAKIIIRRLEGFITDKESHIPDLKESLNTLTKKKSINNVNYQITKIEKLIKAAERPVFTIIFYDEQSVSNIKKFNYGETVLNPDVILMTYKDMSIRLKDL
jgi:hypothetical protein